jgi:hypothetical protein
VLLGPALYHNIYFLGQNAGSWLTALTGVSGAVTALLGKSSLTAKTDGAKTWPGLTSNIVLAIAGSLFVVLLLILLSVVTDLPFLGPDRPMYSACFPSAMVVSGCQPSD